MWILMLVLPITFIAVIYLLLEDTEYRPLILKVLIGANIVGYVPFVINTQFHPIGLLFFVFTNPALYLALTLAVDQTDWINKNSIGHSLLALSAFLSVALLVPRFIAYAIFQCMLCGGCSGG